MSTLSDVLERLGAEYKEEIWSKSKIYCVVDLGDTFREQGFFDDSEQYDRIKVVVPLKRAKGEGISVEIDGKDLSDYSQLTSGLAVPEWVAVKSGLERYAYQPKDKMILTGVRI